MLIKKLMATKTNLVIPSRAGDQFHYIWAARRCLRLLSDSDLTAITIEGASSKENPGDQVSEGEEIIDIGEYFGSEGFEQARLVRYLQLKHSTLHSTSHWTASGLEKTIIGFAERYRRLVQISTEDEVEKKLQFAFVTNRPISSTFLEALEDAASNVDPRHPNELLKLKRFTSLTGEALARFAKLLRLEGQHDDYWDQRNLLHQETLSYLAGSDIDAPARLKELVVRRALHEGGTNSIEKADVLRALNVDEGVLYPAKPLITEPQSVVLRAEESIIVQKILDTQQPIIVHAAAGVGKTVFASRIGLHLPLGSVCVLYDCFGNGQYRSASGYRHRHRDALVQIANELAAQGLCYPLIPTIFADASDYTRAFLSRLNQASILIRSNNPEAVVCVAIDAADNAQMAAEEVGESKSFVRDLIKEVIPTGARLVFLCRTHRQGALEPPSQTVRIELRPFNKGDTAAHLRAYYPEASDRDVEEFHRLTSQNPRVQALALSRRESTLPHMMRLLGPEPKNVDDAIGDLIEAAIAAIKDVTTRVEQGQIDRVCTALSILRPLVPISVLAQLSGVDEGVIRSFCVDLGHPLLLNGDFLQFRDEPTETWFRDHFRPNSVEMARFNEGLKPLATTSAYVASVLPQLMLEAGQFSELVDLALASEALPEASLLEKRNVELQRLQFATKAALRLKRYLDATKLCLKTGSETASEDRRRRILQGNTDLVARFLPTEQIQDLVSRRIFHAGWTGSHLAYEAAVMSGRSELFGEARSHLRMAYEWLNSWSRLSPEEKEQEEIADLDIVELTLAELNLHGGKAAADNLRRWRPREVSFRVGKTVARRLIDHGRFEHLDDFVRGANNNLCLVLAVIVELREVQKLPPRETTVRAFRLVSHSRIQLEDGNSWDDSQSAINAVTALVECAILQNACSLAAASKLLSRYLPADPPRAISSRYSKSQVSLIRAYCLKAAIEGKSLEPKDLAYRELREKMEKEKSHTLSQDVQEFQGDVGALLPWCEIWALAVLGLVSREALIARIGSAKETSRQRTSYYLDKSHSVNQMARLWWAILHQLEPTDDVRITEFFDWKENLDRPLYTTTLISLARIAAQFDSSKRFALNIAHEAFSLIRDEREDAERKAEAYTDVARSLLSISHQEAEAYFSEGVEEASRIGDENLQRWDAILELAEGASRADQAFPEMAYRFARCAEVTYHYVDRDKHFDWVATVEALCGLCPASSLAILSRWRDRDFGNYKRTLPIAISNLVQRGGVDARDVVPLFSFDAQWNYTELLDGALTACCDQEEKERVARHVLKYIMFSGASDSNISHVLERHAIPMSTRREAAFFYEGSQENPHVDQVDRIDVESVLGRRPSRSWDEIFRETDFSTTDNLSIAYTAFKRTPSPWNHEEFFEEVISRVLPGRESDCIDTFVNTPEFDLYDFRRFFDQFSSKWQPRPAVRKAVARAIKKLGSRYCMEFARNRYYEVVPIKSVCSFAGIKEAELFETILDAIAEVPDSIGTNRSFSLIGLLTEKLSNDESLDALSYGLNWFDDVLEDNDGDGRFSHQLIPELDVRASLAGFVWASLAQPATVVRWDGAHAVRGIVALGRKDVLDQMFAIAKRGNGGAYVDARLPFYGLHALQWFLIGVARAALESPSQIAPFQDQLVAWAMNAVPHVMIRQFAARAVLALMDRGLVPDRVALKNQLGTINVSPFPVEESKKYERQTSSRKGADMSEEDRFYFDLDIGPYWYAPLAGAFAVTRSEVEREALKVIREEFKYSGKGGWNEDERARRNLYPRDHAHHSHGSYPRADTLHFYNSYHAMMVVAGKLLARTPTFRDAEYGAGDEFTEWLRGHELSRSDGRWLWDRRDIEPVERQQWKDQRKTDEGWQNISGEDFDNLVMGSNTVTIWGHATIAGFEIEQSSYIRSALVCSDRSLSLLRALGTARDHHDYAIPTYESDMEIDEPGFSLKGWIVDVSSSGRLDSHDRWSGGVNWPPPMPAAYITELMGIAADEDNRTWGVGEESPVIVSRVWGHYDEGNRHEEANPTRGDRLQVDPGLLRGLLKRIDKDLIVKLEIERRRRYRRYESVDHDEKRVPTKTRLYLFRQNGQLLAF